MSEYETMGDGYETMGAEYETVGQVPRAALRPGMQRFQAQPQQPQRQPARFLPPGIMRQAMPQGPALSETQVRRIVAEELQRTVPWGAGGIPPRPAADEGMLVSGLGAVVFDSTTGIGPLALTSQPQRPFRGERLVLSIQRTGASAQGRVVILDDFKVGDLSQKVGGGALPADVFAADAFGVRLMLDATVPGVTVTLSFRLVGAALAAGDTIVVSGALIGRAALTQG